MALVLLEDLLKVEVRGVSRGLSPRIGNEAAEVEVLCDPHSIMGTHAKVFRGYFEHLNCVEASWLPFVFLRFFNVKDRG